MMKLDNFEHFALILKINLMKMKVIKCLKESSPQTHVDFRCKV